MESGSWEPNTLKVLDDHLSEDSIFVDIGVWIGPTTLYAASLGAKCYGFEPDDVAFSKVSENVKLNDFKYNPTIANKAVTSDGTNITLYSRWEYGDSGSSLLKRIKSKNAQSIKSSIPFDSIFEFIQEESVALLKMDIEGGEFFILPQNVDFIKKHNPTILLSLHFNNLIEFLEGEKTRLERFLNNILDPQRRKTKEKAKDIFKQTLLVFKDYDNIILDGNEETTLKDVLRKDFETIDSILFKFK